MANTDSLGRLDTAVIPSGSTRKPASRRQPSQRTGQRPSNKRPDGRFERSKRTRQSFIDAFIELVGKTGTMPSVEALAALSERSVRIFFDRFETLDCLAAEAFQQILSSHDLVLPTQLLLQDFEDRLDWYVRTRAGTCEAWRHMWPMMAQFSRKDTRCAAWANVVARLERERCQRLFSKELDEASKSDSDRLLLSLEILLGVEIWARLREGDQMTTTAALEYWKAAARTFFSAWSGKHFAGAA